MKVYACNPRGYCSGVIHAINLVLNLRKEHQNSQIFVYGKLVHNEDVIKLLDKNNIITLNPIQNIELLFKGLEKNSYIVFTAHGHPHNYEIAAKEAGLQIVDATCPRVKENMDYLKKEIDEGNQAIYIGKALHPETIAALSISNNIFLYEKDKPFDYSKITADAPIILNQTTLSFLDIKEEHQDIKKHIPNARIVDEICNATLLRQKSVLSIPNDVDIIFVVGGSSSSNTQKLYEIASSHFSHATIKRILNIDDIKKEELSNYCYAAVVAGTSTPLDVTNQIIDYIKQLN